MSPSWAINSLSRSPKKLRAFHDAVVQVVVGKGDVGLDLLLVENIALGRVPVRCAAGACTRCYMHCSDGDGSSLDSDDDEATDDDDDDDDEDDDDMCACSPLSTESPLTAILDRAVHRLPTPLPTRRRREGSSRSSTDLRVTGTISAAPQNMADRTSAAAPLACARANLLRASSEAKTGFIFEFNF